VSNVGRSEQIAYRKMSSGTQLRRQNIVSERVGGARKASRTFGSGLLHGLESEGVLFEDPVVIG
jgi:hypothetical protein